MYVGDFMQRYFSLEKEGNYFTLSSDDTYHITKVMRYTKDTLVEVVYDKFTGAKGWVMTEDRMQFLPWLSFYNLYGRKYGLRFLKDVPDDLEVLRAKSEEFSQEVAVIKYARQIKLTAMRGNWALVTVVDIDKTPKTGYMRWRSDDGQIYAFPNIK